jgi:outer membrane protein assembly factor BamB
VQLKDNRVELLNTPGKTVFAESQTNEPSKITFEANAFGDKVVLAPPIANLESEYKAVAFKTVWSLNPAPFTCTKLATAHFQKDAPKVLLASTAEGNLLAISPEGEVLWSKAFPTQLNDVAAGDVDGDGIDEIAIARQDAMTTLLDASGKELWSRQLSLYRVQPYVNLVRMGDLDGDGKDEVVIGSQNWRFYVYNGDGKELWQYETVHPSRSGAIADLDGDGKQEVLAGTHYYTAWALSHDGKLLWGRRFTAPICYDIATGSFDGDKTRGVIFGGGDGTLYYTDSEGKERMQYDTGDEVRHVVTADLDGDSFDEMLATSDNGYLYCFGANGKLLWLRQLGDAVTALATVPVESKMATVVGTRKGHIYAFDAKGNLLRQQEEASKITQMTADGNTLKVATEDGRLLSLTP